MIVTAKPPRKRREGKRDHPPPIARVVKVTPRRRREWPEVEVTPEVWGFFRKMGIKTVPEDDPKS